MNRYDDYDRRDYDRRDYDRRDYDRRDYDRRDYDRRDYDRRDYDRRDYDRRDYDRRDYDRRDYDRRDYDHVRIEHRLMVVWGDGPKPAKVTLGDANVTDLILREISAENLRRECDDHRKGYDLSRHVWSARARLGTDGRIYVRGHIDRGDVWEGRPARYDDYEPKDNGSKVDEPNENPTGSAGDI